VSEAIIDTNCFIYYLVKAQTNTAKPWAHLKAWMLGFFHCGIRARIVL